MTIYYDVQTISPKTINCSGRIYCIGDIHGCVRLLMNAVVHLESKEKITDTDCVIFLGDYIDRGANSKDVIELLISFKKNFRNSYFLMGNHEDGMLDALTHPNVRTLGNWNIHGGDATVKSYGTSLREMKFPEDHIEFLKNLDLYLKWDKFLISHSGGTLIDEWDKQTKIGLLWSREQPAIANDSYCRIFGHTPRKEIDTRWYPHAIGIDQGSYMWNQLTCLELKSLVATTFNSYGKIFEKHLIY